MYVAPGTTGQGNPSEPSHPSHLMRATSAGEEDATAAQVTPSIAEATSAGETAKET